MVDFTFALFKHVWFLTKAPRIRLFVYFLLKKEFNKKIGVKYFQQSHPQVRPGTQKATKLIKWM